MSDSDLTNCGMGGIYITALYQGEAFHGRHAGETCCGGQAGVPGVRFPRGIAQAHCLRRGRDHGCFRDKAALLEAVVGEVYDAFMGNFLAAQDAFKAIPPEEQPDHVGMSSADYIHWAVGYMLEHRDEFRIILLGSEGTRFGRLIDEMVEIETAATNDFLSVLRSLPRSSRQVSPMLEHMVVGSMFAGFMEIVLHDMSLEEAREYSRQLMDFFTAGWLKIMGL